MFSLLVPLVVFSTQCIESIAFECPSSATRSPYDGACYDVRSSMKSFSDAELDCAASGRHLTSIHNQAVQDWLAKLTASANVGTVFWIGAVARSGAADWTWTDGSPWNFTYWATGKSWSAYFLGPATSPQKTRMVPLTPSTKEFFPEYFFQRVKKITLIPLRQFF